MEILVAIGEEIAPYIDELARLRIAVFREFPYLYEGSEEYEARYLSHYAERDSGICVLVVDDDKVVGASTGMWLNDADAAFRKCFERPADKPDKTFYFGESVLLPDYRGRGIGNQFFDEREKHARSLGAEITTFCAVERTDAHPACPDNYRPLAPFWERRGYEHQPDRVAILRWTEIGDTAESEHRLSFWLRHWP